MERVLKLFCAACGEEIPGTAKFLPRINVSLKMSDLSQPQLHLGREFTIHLVFFFFFIHFVSGA